MIANVLSSNPAEPDAVREALLSADADVLVLLESPAWLIEELKDADGVWRTRYPHYWIAGKADAGFRVMLSRWPQHSAVTGERGAWLTGVEGFREAILDRPGGAFTCVLVHPSSPRSPARWRDGNAHVRRLIDRDADRVAARGLPLIAAGDLNGSPTGARSRIAADGGGLRRAKPLLRAEGTWPAWSVWPATIAIDDVLVSIDIEVFAWETRTVPGSDHEAVVVDMHVPLRGAVGSPGG
jgi:endonuclease/exonuclease/phosphatase (EEP) superfamily protein YafD